MMFRPIQTTKEKPHGIRGILRQVPQETNGQERRGQRNAQRAEDGPGHLPGVRYEGDAFSASEISGIKPGFENPA